MHYFGPWDDPDAALGKYLDQKDALHGGLTPRTDTRELQLKDLANHYLNAKQALVDSGELSPRTWVEYKAAADFAVRAFGKHRLVADVAPDDFARLRYRKTISDERLRAVVDHVRGWLFGKAAESPTA